MTESLPWKAVLLLFLLSICAARQVLTPSQITISHNKPIVASATCGEVNGQPISEIYCSLAGSSQYTPLNAYSYSEEHNTSPAAMQELRNPRELFIHGGHGCGHCEANSHNAHPAENMVDGNFSWWQSPPLSRGMQYNQINITIDLLQEFHVAYVWLQMANSPKPGIWILEKSVDHGQTFTPWHYFADNDAECHRRFGVESLAPITSDDQVICRSDFSSIQPLENGEVMINLMENRPSRDHFMSSASLQNFTRATTVRLRLLGTRTLQGHLMDLNERRDPTVTRRYYYAIKEILMGGRCVCNGHAKTCDIINPNRPKTLLCRCEHNTCGDMCQLCCPGFVQNKWQPTTAFNNFTCEPCNCYDRSNECVYEEELDAKKLSIDIHGNYKGGGRCLNCRFNTEGVNCNKCVKGFFRPKDRTWNDTTPCETCNCDANKHSGECEEETGKCRCQARFTGENCDVCSPGYHSPPECLPCSCSLRGTLDQVCLPQNGACPCKPGFGGNFCDRCADGFTNTTEGCVECSCSTRGSVHSNCSTSTGECVCNAQYAGKNCEECALGYYLDKEKNQCVYCECDPSGTEGGVCDAVSGQCLCKEGFFGRHCDTCDVAYYGYPQCKKVCDDEPFVECECDPSGSSGESCDSKTGECNCRANYTSRTCGKCAAGFYEFPECKECSCLIQGSKGQTCDQNGQCFCKENFEGERCDKCKPNLFNFPLCEACNCNPAGVTTDFAGCDKVAPGELCSCRQNVKGRMCEDCKETFWDLQYYHREGCVECKCNVSGTISRLDLCSQRAGQCHCKKNVAGRVCDKCAPGYYQLKSYNPSGCEPCKCDVGGSLKGECDSSTGQCNCKPRVGGLRCDQPIDNHFFPTLWHHKYEAEDGRSIENRPVRFAIDKELFPDFSGRGFAVFSTIQEEIILEVDIPKASVYRLLLKVHNPSIVTMTATITFSPLYTNSHGSDQSSKTSFAPSSTPYIAEVGISGKPFVLNPGKWALSIKTKQRLFVDYAVVLPSEYYEGATLVETHPPFCLALPSNDSSQACLHVNMPQWPSTGISSASSDEIFLDENKENPLPQMSADVLPSSIGKAAHVKFGNDTRVVYAFVDVPFDDEYVVVLEYFNVLLNDKPVQVRVGEGNDSSKFIGSAHIHHCPYSYLCRDVVSSAGEVSRVDFKEGKALIIIELSSSHDFGLAGVHLMNKAEWGIHYVQPVTVCMRKEGVCQPLLFPPAASSVTTEAEAAYEKGSRPISGDQLPFNIANAEETRVMSINADRSPIEVSGVVPLPNHYMLLVHYFNPSTQVDLKALLTSNDHFYETTVPLVYCPSVGGCRSLVRDSVRPQIIQFYVEDKYTLQIIGNDTLKEDVYIDHVTAVPYQSFSSSLMSPLPLYLSADFVEKCSHNHFENDPSNVTDFCKAHIFSLTTHFNQAAHPCECNSHGSTSFTCMSYGGQCECKDNVMGRRCDRCVPGHYSFPDCFKCNCGKSQQCDDRTGQCFCPQDVEGRNCDRCVSNAFGFDALIGCQKCDCHPQGSHQSRKICDPDSGQCLCRESVGGRKCDSCLPGHFGFPYCHECRCNRAGSLPDICDSSTAKCKCKENVMGEFCDQCKSGTFSLSADNDKGCVDCYCFGVTDHCVSSQLPLLAMSIDMSEVTTTDENGTVSVDSNNRVNYAQGEGSKAPKLVYFDIPLSPGKDYTRSYGLVLQYKLSCEEDSTGKKESTSDADLVLTGHNITAYFWAEEQPANPSQPFSAKLRLSAEHLLHQSGRSLSREEVMLLLHGLSALRVKASYWAHSSAATLYDFFIESADEMARDAVLKANSVERCGCPAPYTGLSCQECVPGNYRVEGGAGLGSCIPCECNGHSGTCDSVTGICSDCQHDTEGDHCERCQEGFFGDATTASPYACSACQCPFAPENNFATSCNVSSEGFLLSCNCKTGYSGDRCEFCDTGFFGEPASSGGQCETCSCNDNNDLSDPNSCHPVTGHCFLCQNNTYGEQCQLCAPWYYGDAVTAKNCQACTCDQCGSYACSNTDGLCSCKPNVVGEDCDQCAPDHYGYSRCGGCYPCECGLASAKTQCDAETGQCPCRLGAAGLHCEQCESGYWDYGVDGCTKCDCESSLSLGRVCDVKTGQCHCQEGATGSRCDKCLPTYLRIPEKGCRQCDECVHHLVGDVNALDGQFTLLNVTIFNISAATIDGARLARNSKKLALINSTFSTLEDLQSTEANSRLVVIRKVIEDAALARLHSEDSFNRSENNSKRAEGVAEDTYLMMLDVKERAEHALTVVDSVRGLQMAIQQQAGRIEAKPEWIQEANETLSRIDAANANVSRIDAWSPSLSLLEDSIAEVKRSQQELRQKIEKQKKRKIVVEDFIQGTSQLLAKAANAAKIAQEKSKKLSLLKVDSIARTVQEDIAKNEEISKKVPLLISEVKETSVKVEENVKELNDVVGKFKDAKTALTKGSRRKRNMPTKRSKEVESYVASLEDTANTLNGTFESTRDKAARAVSAAEIYEAVAQGIQKAKKEATAAAEDIQGQSEEIARLKENVTSSTEASQMRLKSVEELKAKKEKELVEELRSVEKRRKQLQLVLAHIKERASKLGGFEGLNATLKESLRKFIADHNLKDRKSEKEEEKKRVEEVKEKAEKEISACLEGTAAIKQARANLLEMNQKRARLPEKWEEMAERIRNGTNRFDRLNEQFRSLKESLAMARNAAEKLKLGVHLEKGSSLDVHLQQNPSHSAVATELSLFARTVQDGVLVYLGNAEGAEGSEYLAVQVEDGKPTVSVQLGDQPNKLNLNTAINDGEWHQIRVSRLGRSLDLSLLTPNGKVIRETRSSGAPGNHAILNLNRNNAKMFVGGIPEAIQVPIEMRDFVGDISDVILNGENIGLWSTNEKGLVGVTGAGKPPNSISPYDKEVGLSGDGFLTFKMGFWNPRKRSSLTLAFLTYAPDGLLFYVGKDRDFMSLQLSSGLLKLSVDFGSGVASFSTENSYNDGKWHTVTLVREEKEVRLQVDEEVQANQVPGEVSELRVSDFFFLGGVPLDVQTRSSVEPFKGCLKNVKLGSEVLNLHSAFRSKGISEGCPSSLTTQISLLSERSSAVFENISLSSTEQPNSLSFEFSLRFKTRDADSLIATISNHEEERLMSISIINGGLFIGGSDGELFPLAIVAVNHGFWHYVAVRAKGSDVKAVLDDIYFTDMQNVHIDVDPYEKYTIRFGKQAEGHFVGCVRDVVFGGNLLEFSKSIRREVRLTGCSMKERAEDGETDGQPLSEGVESAGQEVVIDEAVPMEYTTIQPTTEKLIPDSPVVRRATFPQVCALDTTPGLKTAADTGHRFGLTQFSRVLYRSEPDSIARGGDLSLWLRVEGSSGPVVFMANKQLTDHFGLFILDGFLVFSFNTGSGQIRLRSRFSLLDRRWHHVKASRKGNYGQLSIDDDIVEGKGVQNAESVDYELPLFLGGVDNQTYQSFKALGFTDSMKPQMTGCIKGVSFNNRAFEVPSEEVGTVPCSNATERGLFLGEKGGHSVLSYPDPIYTLKVDIAFKSRVTNGLLFSIGKVEFVALSFENGSPVLRMKTADGVETKVVHKVPRNVSLCDGHWHHIKIFRKKNLLTMTVDGKSNMKIGKKAGTDFALKDPMVIGKPDKLSVNDELNKLETFVGCVRVSNESGSEDKRRMRRDDQVEYEYFEETRTFGDAYPGCSTI